LKDEEFLLVKEIYDYYILHSTATFHTEPVSLKDLKEFIFTDHPIYKTYLIYVDDTLAGYCYFSYFKKREAYNRTAEITIYLKPEFTNKGIGKASINFLENIAKESVITNFLAVITGNNVESIKLFEKMGYTKCAHFKNVGEKLNQILDVVIYQKEFK
jgi:phosphinothricin acetyltransferase